MNIILHKYIARQDKIGKFFDLYPTAVSRSLPQDGERRLQRAAARRENQLHKDLAKLRTLPILRRYILDEPTTGLHAADVHKLIEVLQRLVEAGNTVLVIEHNLDVIKTADYLIDLGPEGGDGGGTLVASGTPEEVAQIPESYTGQYLKSYL